MRLRTFGKIIAAFLLVLLLLVGGLVGRLAIGPVSLGPIEGLLERVLSRAGPFELAFTQPALAWSRDQGAVLLQVRDLELRDHAGNFVASAPSIGLSLDAASLLRRRAVAVREAEIKLPSLQLVRQADRRLVLAFGGSIGALPLDQATGGGVLGNLTRGAPEAGDARVQTLRRIRVSAESLQFTDEGSGRTIQAGAARLRLTREAGGWELRLDLEVGGTGRLRLTALPGETPGTQAITLDLQRFPPAAVDGLFPDLVLAGVEPVLFGRATFALDTATFLPGPGRFSLRASAGQVALPGILAAPLRIQGLKLAGEGGPGWEEVALKELELTLPKAALRGGGKLRRGDGRVEADLQLKGDRVDTGTLLALWPPALGPPARHWAGENLRAGIIDEGGIKLSLPLRPEAGRPAASLDARFSDAVIRFLPEWPPAEGADGTAKLGPHAFTVEIPAATIGTLAGREARVTVGRLGEPGPAQLDVALKVEGPLPVALDLLDRAPLQLTRKMGFKAADARGAFAAELSFGLPLKDGLRPEEVTKAARVQLRELAYKAIRPGFDVTGGTLAVKVDDAAALIEGDVALNTVPLKLTWRERLAGKGDTRRIDVAGELDRARLEALGAVMPAAFAGSLGGTATVIEARNAPRRIEVAADFAGTVLTLPELAVAKAAGEPGRLTARLEQREETAIQLVTATATSGALTFRGGGDFTLKPFSWQRIGIDELRTPAAQLKGTLGRKGPGLVANLDAERLDLRPWQAQAAAAQPAQESAGDLDLALRARSLLVRGEPLTEVDAKAARVDGQWQTARLNGRLPGGAVLSLALDAQHLPGTFSGEADDLGALGRALAIERPKLDGGRGRVEGNVEAAPGGLIWSGEAKLREFQLRDAPLLAQILGVASFQGIGNAFAGRGLGIDRVTVPFSWQGSKIELRQARMVGSELGARVDGTVDLGSRTLALSGSVAPLYTLNRLIGRIPLLGNILRGEKADAALAATFSVGGGFDAPQISVNPLAALVPGIIRDLFGGAAPAEQRPPGE